MKTKQVTIEVSEDKLNAWEIFIKQKDSTVEPEFLETFNKLYERIVPKQVKHFVLETTKRN